MTMPFPTHLLILIVLFTGGTSYGEETGLGGRVSHRKTDKSADEPIANARLTFDREDGQLHKEVTTNPDGAYRLVLPKGRYKVSVIHKDYSPYTTGHGFVVVTDKGIQTANFSLHTPGELRLLAMRDLPPAVTISVTPAQVKVGEEFTVTLMGLDDRGLTSVWWSGEETGDSALDKAHMFPCDNKQFVTHTWTVKAQKGGELILAANARDNAYGKIRGEPHQASEGAGMPRAIVTVLDQK